MINRMFGLKGMLVGGGFAFVVGVFGGWKAYKIVSEAHTARVLAAQKAENVLALEALQTQLDAEVKERVRLSAQLDDAQNNVRQVTREIIKEVPRYVENSTPNCDRTISLDAVRLLNAAANGNAPRPESPSYPASYSIDAVPVLAGDASQRPQSGAE